tara:strand:+ start:277 stop:552 length:276 start_codon:yes stop_codon:yes gene_type:complete
MKLTNIVGDSLSSHQRVGAKNLFVIGELEDLIGKSLTSIESWADKVGLMPVLDSKSARCPLNLGLNFNSFLTGVDYENDIDKNIPRNYDNG